MKILYASRVKKVNNHGVLIQKGGRTRKKKKERDEEVERERKRTCCVEIQDLSRNTSKPYTVFGSCTRGQVREPTFPVNGPKRDKNEKNERKTEGTKRRR